MRAPRKALFFTLILLSVVLQPFLAIVPLVPVRAQDIDESGNASIVEEIWADPVVFEEASNYIRLNFTMFTIDFYKGTAGYNVIYDINGEIVVHNERQVLQYWKGNQWKQRGVPFDLTWIKVDDYQYNVTRYYKDYIGTFYNVTFIVRSDTQVKSVISIESGQTDEYGLLWQLSGIVHENWTKQGNSVIFGDEYADYEWIGFDWEDVYQSFGNVTETSVETSADGKKANIFFNIGVVEGGQKITIDPATVGTSTALYGGISYVYMRKGFWAEGLFWAFYSNGTNAGWEFSADGTTWTGAFTSIGACTTGSDLSVWFDEATGYVHYARYYVYDLFYRRGTPVNDGTITWSAVEQTIYDGVYGDKYMIPYITVDTNGYAWIGTRHDQPDEDDFPVVLKNANNDGTWALDFAYELSAIDYVFWAVAPVPLTGGKVYVIYSRTAQAPLGKLYDAGWGGEESDLADFAIEVGNRFSAVAIGDNVHLVYTRDTTNQIRHNERVWGVGWNATDVLVQDTVTIETGPALSVNTSASTLACFWTSTVTDHVYYKKYDAGWDVDPTDWIDESTDGIFRDYLISSFYVDHGDFVGLLYVTKLASPYNVKFAFLPEPPPPPLPYAARAETFSIAADAAWTPYDLHTLQGVPKGGIAEIVCANKNIDFARFCGVRTDGSALNRYIDIHEAEGGGVTTATMFVKSNKTTGLIECYSEIGADVEFTLLGYFDADFDFTESITSLGNPGLAWADLDLTASGVPDDAVVQVLMGNEADSDVYFAGVRADGSVLERGVTLDEAEADGWSTLSMVVQSNAGAVIEWKSGSATDVTMWITGWFSSNVDFTEGFTDFSPTVDNTWTEKTIIEAEPISVATFALVHEDSGAETFCGLREKGSVRARMIEEHEQEGGGFGGFEVCISLDLNEKCEVYCEDASEAYFYFMGYFAVTPLKPNIPSLILITFNTTITGKLCGIYAKFFDTEGLDGYIFWNNATSAPGGVNSTFTGLTGTSDHAQENVTLPSSGTQFGAKYYINDTDGNWGVDTLVMFPTAALGVTQVNYPYVVSITLNSTDYGNVTKITGIFNDKEGLSGRIFWNNATNPPVGINGSWIALGGAISAMDTITMPDANVVVGLGYYVNDTDGNWAYEPIFVFPTSSVIEDVFNVFTGSSGIFGILLCIIVPIVAFMLKR